METILSSTSCCTSINSWSCKLIESHPNRAPAQLGQCILFSRIFSQIAVQARQHNFKFCYVCLGDLSLLWTNHFFSDVWYLCCKVHKEPTMHGAEAKQVAHQTMTVVMQHAHASKQHQVATEDDKEARRLCSP